MKYITTSSQKTLQLPKATILKMLQKQIGDQEGVRFQATGNANIYAADLADGSKLCVASFDKPSGKSLAMIDHKNVPAASRLRWQTHWRKSLDAIFNDVKR